MKTKIFLFAAILTFTFQLLTLNCSAQQGVSINAAGTPPDNSSMLDVSSNAKGMLVPRMTQAQKLAIATPANALLIYQTDNAKGFWYYDATISAWVQAIGPAGPTGANGTTGAQGPTGPSGANGVTGATGPVGCAIADNVIKSNGTSAVCSQIFDNGTSVGINNATPNASAMIDITSITKGTLITRMTTAQRNAIASPAQSLLIYNITTKCFEFWENGGWQTLMCACTPPVAPMATAATAITTTSFTANWNASAGATGYYLDVATDIGFTTFVAGYNNLNVNNVLTYGVSGLTCGNTYYYRVKAYNACGTSTSSNTITVITAACAGCVQDQSQLVYSCGTSARNLPQYTVWQSFTAGMTGTLCRIDMGFFNFINGTGTLKIYTGTGTGGTLLQTLGVTVSGNGTFMQTFIVSAPVTSGQVYTFQFIPIQGGGIPDPYGVQCTMPSAYPGGEYDITDPSGTYPMNGDLIFITYVQ